MSVFINSDITNGGRVLLAKANIGQRINFTRIVMGDGYIPGGMPIRDMTNVIHSVINIPISKLKMNADGTVIIGGLFSNSDILTEFFYRELALFAEGEDKTEVLYYYGNAGEFAERITPVGGSSVIEKAIDIVTAISTTANVTANIVKVTNADEISYDDSKTKLEAGNVQKAVEKIGERVQQHGENNGIHVTPEDKAAWNAASGEVSGEIKSRLESLKKIVEDLTSPVAATGNPAKLEELVGGLPLKITADIVSTQAGSGDPSPDNVRKISGLDRLSVTRFSGKNTFDWRRAYDNAYAISPSKVSTASKDGRMCIHFSSGVNGSGKPFMTSFKANTRYTISYDYYMDTTNTTGVGEMLRIEYTDGSVSSATPTAGNINGWYTSTHTTLAGRTVKALFWLYNTNIPTYFDVGTIQMEEGIAATAFESYVGGSYDIALPETIYGLSAYPDIIDLTSGVITQWTKQLIFTGTEAWSFRDTLSSGDFYHYQVAAIGNSNVNTTVAICSHFVQNNAATAVSVIRFRLTVSGNSTYVGLSVNGISTATALKSWLAAQYAAGTPVTLVYPLATPQTTAIDTPPEILSLSGTNTVYTNGGGNDVTVEGRQGWKPFVDKLTAEIFQMRGTINV